MIYLPYRQAKTDWRELEVRTKVDPASLASSVQIELMAVDRRLPVLEIKTLTERVSGSVAQEQATLKLLWFFGLVATLLACVGIYGLASRSVLRRTKEIGIRMALGAPPRSILRLVLNETVLTVLAGIALGVPLALLNARLISSMLFGVANSDPAVISVATLVMIAVGASAGFIPARKATRVDPVVTLGCE